MATEAESRILDAMARHSLTVDAVFVPWSKSRNAMTGSKAKVSDRTLNWLVTLKRDGREVLTTDYGAGIAYCPSYKSARRLSLDEAAAIEYETEHGKAKSGGAPILPDPCDVVASLMLDAGVLDAGGFEGWASEFGFDPDSRKAEAMYRACLEIALNLRAGLGDAIMSELREAAQDW